MNSSARLAVAVVIFAIGVFVGRCFSDASLAAPPAVGWSDSDDASKRLARIDESVARLMSGLGDDGPSLPSSHEQVQIHSVKETKAIIEKLGDGPTAEQLAAAAAMLDSWSYDPADESHIQEMKSALVSRLRETTRKAVVTLQDTAVKAPNGVEAAKLHAEAGRTLALYPMSDEKQVIEEAQQLSTQQVSTAARIEAICKRRVNSAAPVGRIVQRGVKG